MPAEFSLTQTLAFVWLFLVVGTFALFHYICLFFFLLHILGLLRRWHVLTIIHELEHYAKR